MQEFYYYPGVSYTVSLITQLHRTVQSFMIKTSAGILYELKKQERKADDTCDSSTTEHVYKNHNLKEKHGVNIPGMQLSSSGMLFFLGNGDVI